MGFYRIRFPNSHVLDPALAGDQAGLDTGIHHHRWDRGRSIRYFLENGLLSERAMPPRKSDAISTIRVRRPAT